MASSTIPKTHRAIVLTSFNTPPSVQEVPTPAPTAGSAILQIQFSNIASYARKIYNGTLGYSLPFPLVIGSSAIGRIVSLGSDSTSLKVGQLVFIDCTLRGRDNPANTVLSGIHAGGEGSDSFKLMDGEWRDSTYAEYAKMPLENLHVLDEKRLCRPVAEGGLGYTVEELTILSRLLVPYGGLRDIGLKAGETIIIAPATGAFSGAAVEVALAMGARVIAMARDVTKLAKLTALSDRVITVPITGDMQADLSALTKHGPVDAYFDISPPQAAKSSHITSGILALRKGGRVSLMGGITGTIEIPYPAIMFNNLQLRGSFMFPREAVGELIKMVEIGLLKIGKGVGHRLVGKFALENWDEAFTAAEENAGLGEQVLFNP